MIDVDVRPEPWMADGLCAQTDPELFFPEPGGEVKQAKRICGKCVVQETCLTYALDRGERFGIWGGLTERERRRIRKPVDPLAESDIDTIAVNLVLAGTWLQLTSTEIVEAIRRGAQRGLDTADLAMRLRMSQEAVSKRALRNGIPTVAARIAA